MEDWKAESNAEWLTVTKNPDGKGVTVKAPAYDGFKAREAKVTISHGERASYEIKVSQMGYESVLRIPEQNPFFNREGTFYSLLESKVTSIDVPVRPTSISTISLFLTQYRLFAWTQRRPSKRMVSLSFTSTWMLTQLPRLATVQFV